MIQTGRHFLQIPGPTNVPDRVLRAMDQPVIDHRGPEFAELGLEVLSGLRDIFQTKRPGHHLSLVGNGRVRGGSGEYALSPGDRVLIFETGQFSNIWRQIGGTAGPRRRVRAGKLAAGRVGRRRSKRGWRGFAAQHQGRRGGSQRNLHRRSQPRIGSPAGDEPAAASGALLIVDAISSLASIDYRTTNGKSMSRCCGSQKGLMVPPGLGFNAVSEKALAANKNANLPRSYWDWQEMLKHNQSGFFPYTPATNLLFALREALNMLHEEGLARTFFGVTTGMARPRARRCAPGDWRSYARSRWNIPI